MTRMLSGLEKMCGGDNHNVHDTLEREDGVKIQEKLVIY